MDIKDFLRERFQIKNEELLQTLASVSEIRHFEPGDGPLQIGETCPGLYLLVNGCVRCFYRTEDGVEYTDSFINMTGYPINSPDLSGKILFGIQVLIPSDLLYIPKCKLLPVLADSKELMQVEIDILGWALKFHWDLKNMGRQYTAMQRYQWFLHSYPELDRIAAAKDIASFLGMTPVSLSRIRRSLREGKHSEELPPLYGDSMPAFGGHTPDLGKR